ncbi:transcription factor bHLH30-like [Primulina tabacum]|uniref:transcription factor bHLH30-like n=1 Tax=Primulina tabacum TaxID=48773 RepID=UPI003F5ADD26
MVRRNGRDAAGTGTAYAVPKFRGGRAKSAALNSMLIANDEIGKTGGKLNIGLEEHMDKATLLAEVISQVKQMKKTAACASEGLHIPMDHDEVKVEEFEDNQNNDLQTFSLKASLCSDYRPDLLSDLRQSIDGLPVKLLRAEISTLGGRIKNVFFLAASEEGPEARDVLISSVHSALINILGKDSASVEYTRSLFPRKRPMASYFES